jgi:transposase
MNNINMDLREIGWDGMDWIDVAQEKDQWRALVNLYRRSLVFIIIVYLQRNKDFGLLPHFWNYLCLACKSMK